MAPPIPCSRSTTLRGSKSPLTMTSPAASPVWTTPREAGGSYYAVVVPWDAVDPDNATTGAYGLTVTSFLNPPTE